jgi:hypothetical protein
VSVGSNADSKRGSFAAAGAPPDGGKGFKKYTLHLLGLMIFVWHDSFFAFVFNQTPTQLPTPLPTAEPTSSPTTVNILALSVFLCT